MITWEQAQQNIDRWSVIDDPDWEPPAEDALQSGTSLIKIFRIMGSPQPVRMVPDGEGGICFHFRFSGGENLTIDIDNCGTVYSSFIDSDGKLARG